MASSFSKLSIINQALLAIGASSVANENETERSKFISAKLDQLLPLLLLTETWRFAIKYREENTPITENFSPDYRYTYQLPFDYGRFVQLSHNRFVLDFAIVDEF